MSELHLVIYCEEYSCYLYDLASLNGSALCRQWKKGKEQQMWNNRQILICSVDQQVGLSLTWVRLLSSTSYNIRALFFGQITTAYHTHIYVYLEWAIDNLEYTFSLCKRNKLALVLNDRGFLVRVYWYSGDIEFAIPYLQLDLFLASKIHIDSKSIRIRQTSLHIVVLDESITKCSSSFTVELWVLRKVFFLFFFIQVIAWSSVDFIRHGKIKKESQKMQRKSAKKCMNNISKWSKN